jgi:hypothetical protein
MTGSRADDVRRKRPKSWAGRRQRQRRYEGSGPRPRRRRGEGGAVGRLWPGQRLAKLGRRALADRPGGRARALARGPAPRPRHRSQRGSPVRSPSRRSHRAPTSRIAFAGPVSGPFVHVIHAPGRASHKRRGGATSHRGTSLVPVLRCGSGRSACSLGFKPTLSKCANCRSRADGGVHAGGGVAVEKDEIRSSHRSLRSWPTTSSHPLPSESLSWLETASRDFRLVHERQRRIRRFAGVGLVRWTRD